MVVAVFDLRIRKNETSDLEKNHEVFVKYFLDSLKRLETSMTLKYNEIKAEKEAHKCQEKAQKHQAKARAKKERRKGRASQQQEVSCEKK
ncbi:hypothetical protein AgCh_019382 [Apium graveolens]